MSILISAKLNPNRASPKKKSGEQCKEKSFQNGIRHHRNTANDHNESLRTIVLFIYTLVNGIELGYKVITILNSNKLFQENSTIIIFCMIINFIYS